MVEYQLKCCSVANDAVPDCRMVWSGAVCCQQGHQRLAWTAVHLHVWELMDNTSNICSEPRTSLFDWFYCFITLLRPCLCHALKLLLALQDTVATCEVRFGELSGVKVSLQNSSGMCLLKLSNWMTYDKLVSHSKRATFYNNVNTGKWAIIFTRYSISTVNRCGG